MSDGVGLTERGFFSASHAARRVARQGVRSHPVPVALVGECSIPERRAPAALVVPGQLEIVALTRHPDDIVSDPPPPSRARNGGRGACGRTRGMEHAAKASAAMISRTYGQF
jgi:hypothetical protein